MNYDIQRQATNNSLGSLKYRQFTQEDVYRGDGLNLYAYCGNNPVEYCDPSGYAKKTIDCDKKRTSKKENVSIESSFECQKRANEINNFRGDWESRNGTTAVMLAIDNETSNMVYLVSTNAPNKSIPNNLKDVLKDNEIY